MDVNELVTRARAVRSLPDPKRRRRIREDAGASQAELAAALGVTAMTLNRWERGLARPRARHVSAYAALLDELEQALAE